jgi:endonuclease III
MIDNVQLIDFFEEYTTFYESMVVEENTKFRILLSNDLQAIEENILVQQVNAKRMENMEQRRIALFLKMNLSNERFKQIIEKTEDNKNLLQAYYNRIEHAIQQIKYLNQKSMELIRLNLKMIETKKTNSDYGYDMKGAR